MRRGKEYLMQYKKANAKLWRLEEDQKKAEQNIGPSGVNYDGMPHGKKVTSQPERDAIKLTEAGREIEKQRQLAKDIREEIMATIEKLEDENQKNILSALYIKTSDEDPKSHTNPTKWRCVEKMTYICERQGQRIHDKALQEIEKLI